MSAEYGTSAHFNDGLTTDPNTRNTYTKSSLVHSLSNRVLSMRNDIRDW